jgi:hypothetical protein
MSLHISYARLALRFQILWLASSIDATVKIHHFVSVSKDGVDHHCDDFVVGAPVDPWCTGQNGALASLSWIALSMCKFIYLQSKIIDLPRLYALRSGGLSTGLSQGCCSSPAQRQPKSLVHER